MPTLRLKLIATMISGAFMGMAGAPLPYYLGYIEPAATFGLPYAVNSIAMPMIGGTTSWVGPLIGAILLGSLQQIATVTINSAVNLLIVGVLLVAFVIVAPIGIVGLVEEFLRNGCAVALTMRALSIVFIASYCFIVGLLGIIFNLPGLQSQSAIVVWLGVFALFVGSLLLASAYGSVEASKLGAAAHDHRPCLVDRIRRRAHLARSHVAERQIVGNRHCHRRGRHLVPAKSGCESCCTIGKRRPAGAA